jgi:hypothetical protein
MMERVCIMYRQTFLLVACLLTYLVGTSYHVSVEFAFNTFCISFYVLGGVLVVRKTLLLIIYMLLAGIFHYHLFLCFDNIDGDIAKETIIITLILYSILGCLEYWINNYQLSFLNGLVFSTLLTPIIIELSNSILWHKLINSKITFFSVTMFSYLFFLTRNIFNNNDVYYTTFIIFSWFFIFMFVSWIQV